MKILITGGCGFLGSNIGSQILKQQKDELFVLDNLERGGACDNLQWLRKQNPLAFYHRDIRHTQDVHKVIETIRPDLIFHLAGQVAMTTSIEDPYKDFAVNAGGTLNILEAVRKYAPEATVIYSSTNKVYGDLEWAKYEERETRYHVSDFPEGFNESTPLDFHSPYGCSKGSADQYLLDYSRIFNLRTVVFRHSSMYGGRQFSTFDQGWIGWFCQQAYLQKQHKKDVVPFTISGNGKQVRDVLHAEDMVRLYLGAAEKIDSIRGQAFNIGGGMSNSLSLLELFGLLEENLEMKLNFKVLPPRESDQKVFVSDISKAARLIDWLPRVDKVEGIKLMLTWIKENNGDL